MTSDFRDQWNALPEHTRLLGQIMEARTCIQHLSMERVRLRKHYHQSLRSINDHELSCVEGLRELEAELASKEYARDIRGKNILKRLLLKGKHHDNRKA